MVDQPKKPRGFAGLSPERQREIASTGGRAVPRERRTYSSDPAHAAECGRKGGQAVRPEHRSFSRDPELAAKAGRKGGLAKRRKSEEQIDG